MIRINDIKDDELRELAYKRTLEYGDESFLSYHQQRNSELTGCFGFHGTKEGVDFWVDVWMGTKTKIS